MKLLINFCRFHGIFWEILWEMFERTAVVILVWNSEKNHINDEIQGRTWKILKRFPRGVLEELFGVTVDKMT